MDKDYKKEIKTLVKKIQTADTKEMEKFFEVMGKFHNYSFNNMLLIWGQKPDAKHVAGYKTWQKLNRQVQKGEHGIKILAPCIYRKKKEDSEEEEEKIYFKWVTVFDISQTEGEPIPDPMAVVETADSQKKLEILKQVAEKLKIPVSFESIETGYCDGKKVAVSEYANPERQAGILIHEMVHYLAEHVSQDVPTQQIEAEAEVATYIVASRFGVERKSHNYLMSWKVVAEEDLTTHLNNVLDVVKRLLGAIEEVKPVSG